MKADRGRLLITAVVLFALRYVAEDESCAATAELGKGIAVWDTGSGQSFAPAWTDVESWTRISRNTLRPSFQGDVVVTNGRIVAVFGKQNSAIELFSVLPDGTRSRAQLRLLDEHRAPAMRLARAALVENTRSSAKVEATYETETGFRLSATFRVKRSDVLIETEAVDGAQHLRIDCPGRFVVLPDFFADDIVIDAEGLPVSALQAPSENFLLHLTGHGDAIAMCVFENRDQEVTLTVADTDQGRRVTGSEIKFGDEMKIWIALMTAPQIWHAFDVGPHDANQERSLDWSMPFAAQWRTDFTRTDELIDSWEMLLAAKDAPGFQKSAWLGNGTDYVDPSRKRWTTVLGWFAYPCWADPVGQGHIQPLKHRAMTMRGPALIYPINRVAETPLDAYTVVDVVRGSLGVGPCEYILDVEGQQQLHMGRATCAARDALRAIYESKQQKQKRQEIEAALDDALAFVTHIRSRIEIYIEFGRRVQKRMEDYRKTHPELVEFLDEMQRIAREIDSRVAARREHIKTPQHVARMNDEFRRALIDYEGPDVMAKLKDYTDRLTRIGSNQDELVGECRWVVKSLRQRAGIRMALDPSCGSIAQEIRESAQKALANPSRYEAARH